MLYTLVWYLTVQLFALAALPLTLRVFRHLPDRGYAFARPLGILLVALGLWYGASFDVLGNQRVTIVALLAALGGVGFAVWRRAPMTDFLRANRRVIVTTELLFAGALALWAVLRTYSPDIATAGGEKFMEYAFINSILRAENFPPPDPWLSGFAISYYYLGYVMAAMLTKLSGVPASSAFNLLHALLFALTVTGAFSIVYNLATRRRDRLTDAPVGSIGFGLLGVLFVAVLGNLMGVLEVMHAGGIGSAGFWAWLDIKNLNGPAAAMGWIPDRFIWWWQASRVINDGGLEIIDEFPGFSFLLGDNHPHVLALPFVLLCVGMAVNTLRRPPGQAIWTPSNWRFWGERLVPAVLLGALGFLNSWDFPTYYLVYIVAYAIQSWLTQGRRGLAWLADVVTTGLLIAGLGLLLYLPFWVGLQSQARGIDFQGPVKTRLPQYLVMFGPFVVIAVVFLGTQVARWVGVRRAGGSLLPALYVGIVTVPSLLVMLLRGWWTAGFLTVLIGLALAAMFVIAANAPRPDAPTRAVRDEEEVAPARQPAPAAALRLQNPTLHTVFVLFLFALAFALTLLTEFVFIKDNFGSRMNSIFKFYFQAWLLLALASAYASWWLLARQRATGGARLAQMGFAVVLAVMVGLGLVYPVLGNLSRAGDFAGSPTLDGTAWVAQQRPDDFAAIQWLQANVAGQPTILEAPGDKGKSYGYEGRMSAFTGLPTILGWGGHESQWRGNYDEAGRREPIIDQIFRTTDPRQAQQLLDQFGVEYVVYGSTERERYGPSRSPQVTKFERFMDPVFRAGDTVIYRMR